MKKILTILSALVLTLCLVGCGSDEKEITDLATYEDYTLKLENAEFDVDEEGRNVIKVYATYTNNSSEPQYALSCFVLKAFQNNVEITDLSDINGNESTLIEEVKDGASLSVSYVFELTDESDVEVLVSEPTADQTTIGKQTYLYNLSDIEETSEETSNDTQNSNESYLGEWEMDFVKSWEYAVETGVKEEGYVESSKDYYAHNLETHDRLVLDFKEDGNMDMLYRKDGKDDSNWGTYTYYVDGNTIYIQGVYNEDSVCEIDSDNARLICDSFIEDDSIKNLYFRADE